MMQELTFSKEKPALYGRIKNILDINWDDGIIIADGFTIHCKYDLPPTKIIHELVHSKRQEKIGKDVWWDLYISSPTFRLEEEVIAYKREYEFFCESILDRNQRFEYLYELARILSSKQYGNIVTGDEALRLIQK